MYFETNPYVVTFEGKTSELHGFVKTLNLFKRETKFVALRALRGLTLSCSCFQNYPARLQKEQFAFKKQTSQPSPATKSS